MHYATSPQVSNPLRHVSAIHRLWLVKGRCVACGYRKEDASLWLMQ